MQTQNGVERADMQRKRSWELKAITNRGPVVVVCYSENQFTFLFLSLPGTLEIRPLHILFILL